MHHDLTHRCPSSSAEAHKNKPRSRNAAVNQGISEKQTPQTNLMLNKMKSALSEHKPAVLAKLQSLKYMSNTSSDLEMNTGNGM